MKFLGIGAELKEEDTVIKGRQMCGGEYCAKISMYPILTPEEYNKTLLKVFIILLLTVAAPLHVGSLVYAIRSGELDIALENVSLMSMVFMHNCVYWLLIYRHSALKDLFRRIGSGLYNYALPDMKMSLPANRYNFLIRFNWYYTLTLCLSYLIILPTLKIFMSGKISTENDGGKYPLNKYFPVRVYIPFKTDTYFTFWPTFTFIGTVSTFSAFMISTTCSIYLGFNVQIWNQLELLKQSIGRIGERACDLFATRTGRAAADHINTKEFQYYLNWCLKENVKHHVQIIKCFKKFECLLFDWLYFQLLVSGFIICVTLFRVGKVEYTADFMFLVELTSRLLLLTFYCLHVIIYCMAGQKTTNLSHELHEAFYGCNWYIYRNKDFSDIVAVCLAVSNRPFVVSGFGMIPANAETLVNIMKSTFSLLNFVHFLVG